MNPNSLITELQTKTHAHSAANSFIEAISKTQVSLKIPQIRLFSLQCGLAEGDKISNAFVSTIANPDEFITLSLFTICIYSIETQLIDSQSKTSAIFMIDKIDTQFCRLYEPESVKRLNLVPRPDEAETNEPLSKMIKLSCISDENSKTSIKHFKDNNCLRSLIMYECAFDEISIKAIKKLNDEIDQQRTANGRLSICEFDISKIWFSFPEPPTSPKGKRKIPFSRFDWNLLSSVSPAVISWLCASKDNIKSLKDLFSSRNKQMIEILAALIVGSFKNKEYLENVIECRYESSTKTQIKNDQNLSSRLRNKVGNAKSSHYNEYNKSSAFTNEMQQFLQAYLTSSSLAIYKDPNCRLVNIIRNYLFYFTEELNSDLKSPFMPDSKYLKKGINEVLNSWSNIILNSVDRVYFSNVSQVSNGFDLFRPNNNNMFSPSSTNPTKSNDNYRFLTEIRENKHNQEQQMNLITSLNENNLITTQIVQESSNSNNIQEKKTENNNLAETVLNLGNNQCMTSSDESVENYPVNVEKSSADEYEKAALHGHVGPQLRNTSKIFKPVLNFIGIDAPSGTLIDNLFKEFGSLLFGNLNIKSVQINILGSINSKNVLVNNTTIDPDQSNFKKFHTRKSEVFKEIGSDKIITTILSFDDLLFNLNVRQVLPENVILSVKQQGEPDDGGKNKVGGDVTLSMSNPIYNSEKDSKASSSQLNSHKYYTKIDAGIRVNDLTQEVNMPLLRLVHQIYSIIADAIEYDKEQNKMNSSLNFKEEQHSEAAYLVKIQNFNQMNLMLNQQQNLNLNLNKDCWKYMGGMLELREFIPEPKYVEKVGLDLVYLLGVANFI